jgi:hypothetical protein
MLCLIQAQSLENEAGRVLNMRQGQKDAQKMVEEQQYDQ